MKYKDMTSEQLKTEIKYLQKEYYNPRNRTGAGKQTSAAFKEYGEKIYEIKRTLLERNK